MIPKKNTSYKRFWGVFLLLVIVNLGLISAWSINPFADKLVQIPSITAEANDISNFMIEDFNNEYGILRLSETFFWIETDAIAEYSLIKNTKLCIDCEQEIKVTLYQDRALFDEINQIILRGGGKELNLDVFLLEEEEYYVEVPDKYKEVCKGLGENASCIYVVDTYKQELRTREIYNEYSGEVLEAGNYQYKITGTIGNNQKVDIIQTSGGEEFTQWATWTSADCRAVGGTITIDGDYCVHTFTGSESFNISGVDDLDVEALVISGGGGGGGSYGAGGGGGLNQSNLTLSVGNISVVIGEGGAGGVAQAGNPNGIQGGNSSFGTMKTIGGGYGGGYIAPNDQDGGNGGSGGSGSSANDLGDAGLGTTGQGYNAGTSITGGTGAGGGGAGGLGGNSNGGISGDGGIGITSGINGTLVCYAGGGGGGQQGGGTSAGSATCGGGAGKKCADCNGDDGIVNTGGGGGGTGNVPAPYHGGAGGDGVVIVRYEVTMNPPNVTQNSPVDFYNSSSFATTFNCSSTDVIGILNSSLLIDGVINQSFYNTTANSNLSFQTTQNMGDGLHNWSCSASNTLDLETITSNRTLTIDTISPTINIVYPPIAVSDNYISENNKTIYLNWTTSDTNLDTCWYYNNSANVTITCGDNATFYLPYGTYTHIVYANDSVNHVSSSSVTTEYGYKLLRNAETYTVNTTENTIENFTMNVSYDTSSYNILTANLFYNGTNYPTTGTTYDGSIKFTKILTIPPQNVSQNVSFNWIFGLTNASGTIFFNSTTNQQYVNPINASVLGNPYTTNFINFSIYDEATLEQLNSTFSITIDYGISSFIRTISYSNSTYLIDSHSFGFSPIFGTFLVKGTAEYTSPGYITRLYTLPSQSITNVTTNISLYLLNSSDSTSFVVKVRDSSYASVVDAVVYIQRYYPGTDTWTTTEILTTNSEGKGIGHFVTEDVNYRFLVYTSGNLVLTSSSTKIFCEASPCTVTLTIPGDTVYVQYKNLSELEYSLSYSKTTETFTYSYIDSNISAEGGRLKVIKSSFGNYTIENICDTSSSSTTAVLTCDISSFSNGTYYAYGYNNRSSTQYLVNTIAIQKTRNIVSGIGLDGILWTFFLLLGIVMVGLYKPPVAIVFTIAGVVFVKVLGLASIPITAVIAVIVIGGFLLWGMRQ